MEKVLEMSTCHTILSHDKPHDQYLSAYLFILVNPWTLNVERWYGGKNIQVQLDLHGFLVLSFRS